MASKCLSDKILPMFSLHAPWTMEFNFVFSTGFPWTFNLLSTYLLV